MDSHTVITETHRHGTTYMTAKELREQYAKLIADSRKILDQARTENRGPNAEERANIDKIQASASELIEQVKALETQENFERHLNTSAGRQTPPSVPGTEQRATSTLPAKARPEYRSAYNSYLRHGRHGVNGEELRTLTEGVDASGGYTVLPMELSTRIIKALDNDLFIRQLARIEKVTGAGSLGILTLEADPADADWTPEVPSNVTAESTMAFGRRDMRPEYLTKLVKISDRLLANSTMDIGMYVADRLAYKFAVTEEKAYMTGNGVNRPLGLFTAHANGIPTSRDFTTGTSTTAITSANAILKLILSVKGGYLARPSCGFLMHRDVLYQITSLVDTTNRYIYDNATVPGTKGSFGSINGFPVYLSEYAPNTFTTGQYVALFGDFSEYTIAEGEDYFVQVLKELYSESNLVGYKARKCIDAMPTSMSGEAFARLQLS